MSPREAKEMLFVISGTVNYKADRQVSPLPVPMVEGGSTGRGHTWSWGGQSDADFWGLTETKKGGGLVRNVRSYNMFEMV